MTRLFQTKYLAFLTTCWSISPRASVLPLLLTRFDAFSALRQHFSATWWFWILTSKYVSDVLCYCMIYASMIFVKIFLLNNFDFWRQNFSTEIAGKFLIDIATLTVPLSLVHRPLFLLLVVSFCSWFIHILARVFLLEEFRYGIFVLHLEFLNSFIFVALISLFFSSVCLPFLRQLSLSLAFLF